jgi:hypothetical protein
MEPVKSCHRPTMLASGLRVTFSECPSRRLYPTMYYLLWTPFNFFELSIPYIFLSKNLNCEKTTNVNDTDDDFKSNSTDKNVESVCGIPLQFKSKVNF